MRSTLSRPRLCVVVHDVAPAHWAACERLRDALYELGDFLVTLLAVPRYHGQGRDAAFEDWLCTCAAAGDEVALHGFTHRDDGQAHGIVDRLRREVYTRGEAEFWALSFDAATQRLQAGLDWLRALGLRPAGFVAPAWLIGPQAWRALRCQDFEYTCTLRRIHLLTQASSVTCQPQVYSNANAWRRIASIAWNDALARSHAQADLMRLELHPGDIAHADLRRSWQGIAARALRSRRACTLHTFVASQPLKTAPAWIPP